MRIATSQHDYKSGNYHVKEYSIFNDSEMENWDEFIMSHPKGTPFHLSCWMRTIFEAYSFEPHFFVLENENNDICGILPYFLIKGIFNGKRAVCLPFSDFCGPLLKGNCQENYLLRKIIQEDTDQVKHLEIRSPISNEAGFVTLNYYKHHILNIEKDPSEIEKNIDKKTVKYSIRKARRERIKIKEENSIWGMEEFYRLHLLTRRKHGIPAPPFKFFKLMFDNIVAKDLAFILLAEYGSKVIASGIFFKFKKYIYFKYNASDPQYLTHKTPNHLLTWYAIEQACINGYQFFDFGRTSPENKGLMRYKEMWGAKRIDLPYCYYPNVNTLALKEKSLLFNVFTRIWHLLPDVFIKKVGPKIYKYTG